ncbi:lipopolysaccharide biosynthesis protein [Marinagarivorans algicola]|uniref:lipopolysaccharide biosynthesis protein n=1 Tax=Marinagarivorans algicola TaxID=1513270 RepID=UPI0006B8D397|nr:lipopolysaccharide biosynthesis protein [Marinagarivorans algicola]
MSHQERSQVLRTDLKKAIVFYGLSIVLMKGLSLIMLPFIAGYLSPAALGQLELLTTAAILASLFVAMGLEDCLFRFASNTDGLQQRTIVASLYGWSLIIGLAALLLGTCFAPAASALSKQLLHGGVLQHYHLQMVWAGVALEGAISLPLAYLRMQDKPAHFFYVVIGRTFLQAMLTFIFLHHNASITSVLLASLIATCSQALILGCLQLKSTGIQPKLPELKAIYQYGLPLLGSGLCLFALNGIDKIAIAHWVGLTELGLYCVAAKFALATVLLMQPFGMWWRPKRFAWLAEQPVACGQMLERAILLLALITCAVACIGPILIASLMPDEYIVAAQWVAIIAFMLALRESSEVLNLGVLNQKNTWLLLKINISSAVIAMVLCLSFTKLSGVAGCIIGLIIAQGLRLILIIWGGRYVLNLQGIYLHVSKRWLILCLSSTLLCVLSSTHFVTQSLVHDGFAQITLNDIISIGISLIGIFLVLAIILLCMALQANIISFRRIKPLKHQFNIR